MIIVREAERERDIDNKPLEIETSKPRIQYCPIDNVTSKGNPSECPPPHILMLVMVDRKSQYPSLMK
jgi:hypothetical protein